MTDFVVPCCHPYLCVFYKHCTNAHANIPLWMFGNLAVWLVESGGFEDVNRACGTFGEIDQSRCLFHSETRLEYDQRLGATNHYICVLWRTSTTVHWLRSRSGLYDRFCKFKHGTRHMFLCAWILILVLLQKVCITSSCFFVYSKKITSWMWSYATRRENWQGVGL